MHLKLNLKVLTASSGQPLSWADQLAAMTSQKGESLTRAEIEKLRHKHKEAEQRWRKAQLKKGKKYVTPGVGGRLRNKNCTALADATTYADGKPVGLSKAQQRIAQEAAELRAKGYEIKVSDSGLGLTWDGDYNE